MLIPWQSLSAPTLNRLLEEIVTRDGTDYGTYEKSTEQKITYARNQLEAGYAALLWNPELESASLVSAEHAAKMASLEEEDDGASGAQH